MTFTFASRPWSLFDSAVRLCDGADHLLHDHGCDQHGYETLIAARDSMREMLPELIDAQNIADFLAQANADLERLTAEQQTALDGLRVERDAARAEAAELRLTLAAELGKLEGAPSEGWQPDIGNSWKKNYPNGVMATVCCHGLWAMVGLGPNNCTCGRTESHRAGMLACDAAYAAAVKP